MPGKCPARAIFLALVVLAGCDNAPPRGGALTATLVAGAAPTASAAVDLAVGEATQQGLVGAGANGATVPGLARTWAVDEAGRNYLFRLRADARWADGRRLTAGDAVVALRRARGSPANPLQPWLDAVDTIGSPAPGIVEIGLSRPLPSLLRLLALPPLAIVRQGRDRSATGPFIPAGSGAAPVVLIANPQFHDRATVSLERMTVRAETDPARAVAAFLRGETDLVTGGTTAGLFAARAVTSARGFRIEPTWGVYGYRINPRAGALGDARVRRALGMALDREQLVARLFGVAAIEPARGPLPPTLPTDLAVEPDWAAATLDVRRAAAAALLAEAGFGVGRPLSIEVSVPRGAEHVAILREVTRQWAGLGIVVRGLERPPTGHAATMAAGLFELGVDERVAPAPVAAMFLAPYAGLALIDGAGAAETARQLADTGAIVAIFSPVRWSLISPRIGGWVDNVSGAHPLARLTRSER